MLLLLADDPQHLAACLRRRRMVGPIPTAAAMLRPAA
jgi:hypothetical protein